MMWRKSSRSETAGQCVEVRHDLVAIRDSKCPDRPTLSVPLSAFLATVRAGRLDR
jgi:Domain of unknown function (DUF397)